MAPWLYNLFCQAGEAIKTHVPVLWPKNMTVKSKKLISMKMNSNKPRPRAVRLPLRKKKLINNEVKRP